MEQAVLAISGLSRETWALWHKTRPNYISYLQRCVEGKALLDRLVGEVEVSNWHNLAMSFPTVLKCLGLSMADLEKLLPVPSATFKKWPKTDKRELALAFVYALIWHIHAEITKLTGYDPLSDKVSLPSLVKLYCADSEALRALLVSTAKS